MGFNISGIAINKTFKNNLNELQQQLGITLGFTEEINFESASENWKKEGICDIYFGEQGTLLFLNMDLCSDPWSIENGNTLTFALSETSMAFNVNYCEGRELRRSFMELNGDRMHDAGEKLSVEENTEDVSTIVWEQLKIVLGQTYWSIGLEETAYRYKVLSIDRKSVVNNIAEKKSEEHHRNGTVKIDLQPGVSIRSINNDPDELSAAGRIFDMLISEDDSSVLATVNNLTEKDINNFVLAYILNLTYFHRDAKVRKAARKQFEKYAPADLLAQLNEHWKDKYLKSQDYFHKTLYEHPAIDPAEYIVFSQVIRRNYFLVKPKPGMIAYLSIPYGDEIENIYSDGQVETERVSDKISKLKHITVAMFSQQSKLDISDTIEKLSQLPNLQYLQIARSQLKELPASIAQLGRLKTLVIDHNPISEIPKDVIFPNVEKLNITRTNISTIDIHQFPALKELVVDGRKEFEALTFQNISHDFLVTNGSARLFSTTVRKPV
ncbi:leucine-rich repeat domain-containing protein [Chitinophaga ginsengisoli]|uniref:Leucine rich repeat (LRR) protein n=1 Tax=Chitinophaga ginsengisoli TaxID=363837 RepID=A0A2P8G2M6_9BACT|nr:leucine-rich repeat domain-containing protein [Chitinophaga ginsengisoli]PSL28229.1 hypothetical protein CLV42_108148 [Chitinophaga ginsengisoli]